MRYQVKEALEQISSITHFHPNSLQLLQAIPNQIQVKCTDECNNEHRFMYSDGKVLMWDKVEHHWVNVPDIHL
ncbi:hypothetical protein P7F88_07970 [Vibrio hannami]|uniref:hypothetical protein n=1 Tax=Vibrio hannami TaxID=2717094 RepID=UPI00240F68F7|nr:hypothetical protein [Vibrio hannami]MDG3086034.1 hypothetical protein [Vibrio hannami]